MVADDLVTQGAKASAAIVLIQLTHLPSAAYMR